MSTQLPEAGYQDPEGHMAISRLQAILGRRVEAGESSEDGFVNHDRLERLRHRRQRQDPMDAPGENPEDASAG